MPSIFKSSKILGDFDQFQKDIENSNSIIYPVDTMDNGKLKKFHHTTYCLLLIAKKIKTKHKLNAYKYIFLHEIVSDLLTVSCLMTQGFIQPCQILHRRIIENYFNHLFYFNHEIEFQHLNNGENEFTPVIQLRDYISSHPVFHKDQNVKKHNDNLYKSYLGLCKVVHTKGITHMHLAKNLGEIKLTDADINAELDHFISSLQAFIYVVFRFHRDLTFSNIEKSSISSLIPRNERTHFFL